LLERPPFYVTVSCSSDDFIVVEHADFDVAIVERLFAFVEDEMRFDEVTFPKNHCTVFGTGDDLTVGEFLPACSVGKLQTTIFGDFTLEFQTSESLSHFPESDVTRATSKEHII